MEERKALCPQCNKKLSYLYCIEEQRRGSSYSHGDWNNDEFLDSISEPDYICPYCEHFFCHTSDVADEILDGKLIRTKIQHPKFLTQ